MIARVLFALLLLVAAPAAAREKTTISTEARAGWLILGGDRPTGGLTLGAGARLVQPFGEGPWGWYVGASAEAVGVGDSWHWLGIVAAPEVGAWRAFDAWHVSAGVGLPAGQLPTCNPWGLCIRNWGLFPIGSARIVYRADSFRIGAEGGGMYVNTLAWSGAAVSLRIVGAYR